VGGCSLVCFSFACNRTNTPDCTESSELHRRAAGITQHRRNWVAPTVLVQPEMEKRRSPLVSIPPFGRGFSRHMGLSIR
jgi:hypothetical protein